MPAIFISHSSADNAHAAEIKAWLASIGLEQVFLDFDKTTGIGAGKDWERELYEAIERCQAVIALITPAWLASKWCFAEVANARAQGKPVFPIVFTPDAMKMIGPELQSIQAELWNDDGQKHLGERLHAIADEIARGYRFDGKRPPWPGILSYEAEDAAIFFGRDPEIRRLVEVLDARRVQGGARTVLIVGASGSGKSSLLRAGLLPYLARRRQHWVTLPPMRPGHAPLASFAKMLAEATGQPGDWAKLRDRLAAEPRAALVNALEELRVGPSREATVLFAIDQFEELATLAEGAERDAILTLIGLINDRARALPALLVGTIRSDLLGEVLKIDGLEFAREIFTVGPLPADRLPAIIEGPARIADIHLEQGLTGRILADAGAPEALPLLAFALRELNERHGADKRLTIVEYEALGDAAAGLSPLENAIRRKAEEAFAAAAPTAEETRALREAFLGSLTRISDEGARLKRPTRLTDLPRAADTLIARLTEARLFSMSGEGDERMVEVTHDALFTAWPQLKAWLDEEQDFLHARRQIEEAARMWRAAPPADKPKALLGGLLLARARDWQQNTPERLTPVADFVTASIRRRNTVRRRQVIAGLAAAAGIGIAGTVGARTLSELAAYQNAREEERKRTDLTGDLIVYSTSPGTNALDGSGDNGAYTGALLPRLADTSVPVTRALMASVQDTLDASSGAQRPELVSNLNGDIYLSDPPADRKTVVLPVGINQYDDLPPLQNSIHDAEDMAALFGTLGYAAPPLLDCTRSEFLTALQRAVDQLAPQKTSSRVPRNPLLHYVGLKIAPSGAPVNPTLPELHPVAPPPPMVEVPRSLTAPRNSVFVLYFSGNGFTSGNDTYLVMRDTDGSNREQAIKTSVRVSDVMATLRRIAAVRIVILDTSRNDPFDS